MNHRLLIFILSIIYSATSAQTIKRAEYFFDTDPGKGNGISLTVSQAATINQIHSVSVASLSNGPHTFSYRVLDSNGKWSHVATRTFFIITPVVFANASTIKKVEYFFDHDPGTGNATPLAITASSTQSNTFILSLNGLSSGFHQLAVRYQDNLGHWSMFAQRTFYIVPAVSNTLSTSLKKAEYFFDHDPGVGNGTLASITSSNTENNLFTIAINSLTSGFHQLGIRYQDDQGHWSMFTNRTFYIVPSVNLASATTIKKAEYFFDHDPGMGQAIPLTISATNSENNNFALDINALSSGFHQLAIRYQDNLGRWSAFANRTFYILPGSALAPTLQKIEYFIDTDPGINNGTSLSFVPGPSVNQIFTIDLGTTPPGNHMLYVRTKDSNGYWSEPVVSAPFSILSCTVPTAPLGTNGSRCDVGSVTLSVSGGTGSQQYRWYADGTTNTIALTGPSFSTPSLNGNTDYYASIFDPSTGCESSRTKISAVVTIIPKPALNPSGSLTICQGNSVSISAPPGYASYDWGSGSTTQQQVTTSISGSYSVKVSDGTCSSVSSDPLTLTVVPKPAKPIVQTTGNTTICGSGSVTLTAPVGAAKYSWSDNSTNQNLVVSATGNYTVQITDANNCQSDASDPIAVQVVSVPVKPTITASGSTTLCSNSSAILSAPQGFANYSWSTGATTADLLVTNAGSYTVTVGNGTCTSVASDPVMVTASSKPAKPIVQTTGNTTICGSGSVTLTAPAGAAKYRWSDNSTNQNLVVSAAGNYTVQITDANNCQSDASDPVAVQVVNVPGKPAITASGSTTLCNNSSVILSAPKGFANYLWSTGATSADLLVTNAGSYTVTVGNGTCTSAASDPVVVTAGTPPAKPIIQVQGNTTICGSGSVLLTAPGASSYLWSDGSNGQQVIATTAGKYSVQIVDANNCKSVFSDELAIKVVTIPSTPSIKVFGSTSLCLSATVILAAPSGFLNYRWSNGDTTAAVLVSSAGNYSVAVGNAPNCLSASSLPAIVTLTNVPCTGGPGPNDVPPSIADATINIPVGTEVSFGLKHLIKKGTVGVNLNSLRIVRSPASGAIATLRSADSLLLDFRGNSFVGKDSVGIQVCDSLGSCTQRTLSIDVVADVEVFNAVSPFPDNINDFFNLKYIDKIEDTKKNKVIIVDRWGNEVFSISDYNNSDRVFLGNDNNGKELPSGTYYYRIDFYSGRPTLSGFISLKR